MYEQSVRATALSPFGETTAFLVTATIASSGRFAAGFFEPVGEHGFGVMGGPLVGQHLVETRIVVVQAEQQLAQVGPRLDPVTLGPGKDREQNGRPRPGLPASQEQPILAADRLMPERSFTDVVVDRQSTVRRVTTECLPLVLGVRHGLGQHALGKRTTFQLSQVGFDTIEHGLRLVLTKRGACCLGPRARSLFDVVQLPDPLQDLVDVAGRTVNGVEELAPRMRPTGHFADRVVRSQIDVVVAAVGVGVKITLRTLARSSPVRRGRDSP